MKAVLLLGGLMVGAACSAAPQDAPQNAPAEKPAAAPVAELPKNAPASDVPNVPAITGKANLAKTTPPFAVEAIGQFSEPFAMAFLPDGTLLVTEKAGKLKLRLADGQVLDVADVPGVAAGGQGGLLDVAVSPDYGKRDYGIYITYAEPAPGGSQLVLARASLDAHGAGGFGPNDPVPLDLARQLNNLKVIWRSGSAGPGGQFGATIAFAPDGKSLFLTSGERQRFTPAQDPEQRLGKIMRLTLDGKAWPGNPQFKAGGVRAETWSTGHRNPYGIVFTQDGRLWAEEMGPLGGDELNLIQPGRNYGWPLVSNGDNYSGQPIADHPSRPEFAAPKLWWNPSISPGGMIVYTGKMFSEYRGSLLIAALSDQALIRVTPKGDSASADDQWSMGARIRDVAQAPDGSIWLLEDGARGSQGRLLRLTPRR